MDSFNKISDEFNNSINTDTLTGKIMFVLAVLLGVYILIRIVFVIMSTFYNIGDGEVTILDKKYQGTDKFIFSQNPTEENALPILQSKNQNSGIEFTWSLWLNLDAQTLSDNDYNITSYINTSTKTEEYAGLSLSSADTQTPIHILSKGSNLNKTDATGSSIPGIRTQNNAPGIYLGTLFNSSEYSDSYQEGSYINKNTTFSTNKSTVLLIYMDTYTSPSWLNHPIIVTNLPIQKWFNVCIIAKQSTLYVYINGKLKKFHTYNNVIKQNYDPININLDRIPYGEISSVKYYNRAITAYELNNILGGGANLEAGASNNWPTQFPRYLDLSFYNNL
tara:strand:+ start:4642 stop:5643 length:1002 start_codon:yes stop_codon:yes gene_type:complete